MPCHAMPCHAMPAHLGTGRLVCPRRPPSRRGARELMTKPRPLAVIRNRRLNSVALSVPTTFSSVRYAGHATQHQHGRFSCVPTPCRVFLCPHYVTNGHDSPMQTTGCTWPQVVPIGEDPAAHGHWCAFTDLCHAMPCHTPGFTGRPVCP